MSRLGAGSFFLDPSGIWWQDPTGALVTGDSWDVVEAATRQKTDEDSDLSQLEGVSVEELEVEDPELEAIKAKVREMEEEEERLKELQAEAQSHLLMAAEAGTVLQPLGGGAGAIRQWGCFSGVHQGGLCELRGLQYHPLKLGHFKVSLVPAGFFFPRTAEEKIKADQRSVYVGNVDYGGTAEELESHFNSCGQVNRVTILCDKFSGHPKGYAYIEFEDQSSVKAAVALDESVFRGRVIKVLPKRTNMPGISTTDRGAFWGRAQSRGGLCYGASFCRGQRAWPRGRVYRSRGRLLPWYSPY
ncbi:PREDICTED: embryonic polyadenylate-binding protein 2 isoform X1 [Gavialis gangeticus]|uniref:embryonic polyadenylate-binding protein 2 isoform X1 n=1 Tax=Gavialis gangeticus TaxID=94835 RepID=UPI00092E7B9A|nr:PREDICTED: embryonic polyadenylate-binding protein 2 isoform X1 [Gavialis gangeticus]